MGGIRRSHDFETVPERFVIRDKDRWKQDYFQDEVCLVLEERGELVVIVGCSHPGILNILDTVRQRFSQPIRAWWEGPTWWRLTGNAYTRPSVP